MIYWFTGQPGHGKTVLAKNLKELHGNNIFHVDGDHLREIFDNKDYSEIGRRNNIDLAQKISHYLHNQGNDVVVSLVSPYIDQREDFKNKLDDSILEIYVHTKEIRGREQFHVENYQRPLENFIDIDTTIDTPEQSIAKILEYEKLHSKSRQKDII
jgi:adenylylsulfate kinase